MDNNLNEKKSSNDHLDYVDLWKYFESRGAEVKNQMLSVVTWIIGFAAIILSFIVKDFLMFDSNSLDVERPLPLILFSLIGIAIILYADILISDYGDHINRNFDRAGLARQRKSLDEILNVTDTVQKVLPPICVTVRTVSRVLGAILAFITLIGVGFLIS